MSLWHTHDYRTGYSYAIKVYRFDIIENKTAISLDNWTMKIRVIHRTASLLRLRVLSCWSTTHTTSTKKMIDDLSWKRAFWPFTSFELDSKWQMQWYTNQIAAYPPIHESIHMHVNIIYSFGINHWLCGINLFLFVIWQPHNKLKIRNSKAWLKIFFFVVRGRIRECLCVCLC